jgi:hypothetical protein
MQHPEAPTFNRIALNPNTQIGIEIPLPAVGSGIIAFIVLIVTITKIAWQYRVNTENLVNSLKQLEKCLDKLSKETEELSNMLKDHSVEIELHKQSIEMLRKADSWFASKLP